MDVCQEIRHVLISNDRTISWLASKMRIPRSTLNARLCNPETFSKKDYDKIIDIFKREGLSSGICEKLERETLAIDTIMANSIALLNTTVMRFIEDRQLTYQEKTKLTGMVNTIQNQYNEQFNKILEIIER